MRTTMHSVEVGNVINESIDITHHLQGTDETRYFTTCVVDGTEYEVYESGQGSFYYEH